MTKGWTQLIFRRALLYESRNIIESLITPLLNVFGAIKDPIQTNTRDDKP